jgi:nucleotide-binding universal stress UspA family protein
MHILYATDGSEASLAGAHLLVTLPLATSDQLTLLTVVPEHGERYPEAALRAARDILQQTRASVETKSYGPGVAAEEILRVAEAEPTDLVVVGSRGLGALTRFLIGSTSERVARHAPCSVLVARPVANNLQQVILGSDGSDAALKAAESLKRFPLPEESQVRVVTVMQFLELLSPSGRMHWPAEFRTLYRQHCNEAEQQIKELAASFAAAGRSSSAELRSGDPAASLIQCAEEQKADLLVVGSHGLSAIDRFLLGSVPEKVLRHASCSVLVVK